MREERRRRLRRNAKLRDRLEEEVGEEEVRAMFARSLAHLEGIRAGSVASRRHAAFHQSVRARQALFYTMITHPFTDDQLAWVLEEMSKVWMRDMREQVENNEYVWKVLLPECFIKFYSDHFKVSSVVVVVVTEVLVVMEGILTPAVQVGREEAEERIGETPHRRWGKGGSDSE